MSQLFEVRDGAATVGSFSGDQIKQLAADGTLHAHMEIRRPPAGEWSRLSSVKGLRFKSPAGTNATGSAVSPSDLLSLAKAPLAQPASAGVPQAANLTTETLANRTPPPLPPNANDVECPFCSEPIKVTAKKCKHCGEFLDVALRTMSVGGNAGATRDGARKKRRIKSASSAADVRIVAVYQKRLMICILVWLAVNVAGGVAAAASDELFPVAVVAGCMVQIVAAVFAFFLASKVYDAGLAVVLGIVSLFGCIGLIALLIVNSKATSVLKANGYEVGLMGAKLDGE